MALKTTVKVSHVSHLSDARYCAGMGVEMLGFRVAPEEEHYVSPEVFQDIRGWISGPKIVAELHGVTEGSSINDIIKAYAPDYLEMNWQQYRTFGSLAPLPIIVEFPSTPVVALSGEYKDILYWITQEAARCRDVAALPSRKLKKISTLESLHKSLEERCFSGFVLEGSKPLRPGITSYDQLGDLLEALEED